jgi:hypothetical protein
MSEEETDHSAHCSLGDDDHAVVVRIEYMVREDEDGDVTVMAANIQSHVHGVPPLDAARTLMITAQRLVAQGLADSIFDGCPDEGLKHALADASAGVYMKKMLEELPEGVEEIEFSVPNDLSEMLGEE